MLLISQESNQNLPKAAPNELEWLFHWSWSNSSSLPWEFRGFKGSESMDSPVFLSEEGLFLALFAGCGPGFSTDMLSQAFKKSSFSFFKSMVNLD